MRRRCTAAAQQLHSVCWRYRWPGRCSSRSAEPGVSVGFWPRPAVQRSPLAAENEEDEGERLRRLEAVLFLAREPLSSRKLSFYANLADGTEARTLIRRLRQDNDDCRRAFTVEEVAGGFQLLTRPRFAAWIRRLSHVPPETRLSAPGLETLAVVAYRQPVTRAVVESIRGVSCGEILRQLMDRDLVRISGRSDELGRPYLYSTSKRFMHVFGLMSLDHLPRAETLVESSSEADLSVGSSEDKSHVSQIEHPVEESQVTVCPPSPLLSDEAQEDQVPAIAVDDVRQSTDDDEEYLDDDEDDLEDDDDEEDDLEEDDDDEDDLEDDDEDLDDDEDDLEDDLEDDDLDDDLAEDEWQEVDDDDEDEEDDEDWDDDDDDEDDLDWEEEDEEDWE